MGVLVILGLWFSPNPDVIPRQDALVLTRPSDSLYHWPGCPVVRDATDVLAMTQAQAAGRGRKPHADCDPGKAAPTRSAHSGLADVRHELRNDRVDQFSNDRRMR